MSIFGPYYPPLLQLAMSHAERFAAVLSREEVLRRPLEGASRAWVTGRAEELETMLGFIVDDWRSGRLTEEAAEGAISSYLRAMHAGAGEHLGVGPVPECCLGDEAATVAAVPIRQEEVTVAAAPPATEPPGDTLVDPAAVLADMVGKHGGERD